MSLSVSVSEIINTSSSELLKKHQSWERVELIFIANVLNGYAFNSENFSRQRGIPLIRIRDILRNITDTNYDGPYDEIYLVKQDDLLVGMDGDFNSALWKGPIGVLNQRVCKIEVYQELFDKRFLFYVLPGYLKAINDATSSMTVKHLSSKSVEEILLPLAPLSEQSRIVSAIEQQFTRLDSAVASLQSAKARIKQYRASLLKSAVEGELTEEWRAEHPASETGERLLARILQERRARWEEEQLRKMSEKGIVSKDEKWKERYEEPQEPDVENLPELPDGWCWATVEQLAAAEGNSITDGPFGSNLKTEHYTDSGPRVIRLQNIGDGFFKDEKAFISQDHFNTLYKHQIYAGDLVIPSLGERPPRSCIIPDFVGPAVVKADCIRYKVSPHILNTYINVVLNSEPTKKRTSMMLHGVGRPRLNLSEIKSIVIALPPLVEQQSIMFEVEARLSTIEQTEIAIEDNLKRGERERQSILQEAFAGRLVPQDPDDEPASILLERIREERKKREEAEKEMKISRKGSQMEAARKRHPKKLATAGLGLYEALVEAGAPLQPEEVFRLVGLKVDEQPESVEAFYEQLRSDVSDGLIGVTPPGDPVVLLEALDASFEEEEEEAVQSVHVEDLEEQEDLESVPAEEEKLSSAWPTLWDNLDN